MADLDVSELLLDFDFIDPMVLIKRSASVGLDGVNTVTEKQCSTVGSIQPAPNKSLDRLPEALRIKNVKQFFIKAEIRTDGSGIYPDLILYKGRRYQIISVQDWLNFGDGWNAGLCVVEELAA